MTPNEKQQEQEAQRDAKTLKLARAYEEVFGQEGKRNHIQETVWASFEAITAAKKKLIRLIPTSGAIDPYQTFVLEGHREVYLEVDRLLTIARMGKVPRPEVTIERE